MGLYDLACAAGPTLGPIVAGFAVVANGWRWAFWEMLWITGFALALLSFSMPEVSLLFLLSSFFLLSPFYSSTLVSSSLWLGLPGRLSPILYAVIVHFTQTLTTAWVIITSQPIHPVSPIDNIALCIRLPKR